MKHIKEYEELSDFTKELFGNSILVIVDPITDFRFDYSLFTNQLNNMGLEVNFVKVIEGGVEVFEVFGVSSLVDLINKFDPVKIYPIKTDRLYDFELEIWKLERDGFKCSPEAPLNLLVKDNKIYRP